MTRWGRAATVTPPAVAAVWALRHATAAPVRAWSPGTGVRRRAGGLSVRTFGTGERTVVLLHGLITSGDTFGAGFDRLGRTARVVVPDLLGFARSLHAPARDHGLGAHLDALDAALDDLGLGTAPLSIGGHSMGGPLALHWAARHPDRVDRVIAWTPALFHNRRQAARRLFALNPLLPLIGMPNPIARTICTHLCTRHPRPTSWLYAAAAPELPSMLARQCVQHTWHTYLAAMEQIVLNTGWESALGQLDRAAVPVVLGIGLRDPLAVPGLGRRLEEQHRNVEVRMHRRGDHYLPLTDPDWSAGLLRQPAHGVQPPHPQEATTLPATRA